MKIWMPRAVIPRRIKLVDRVGRGGQCSRVTKQGTKTTNRAIERERVPACAG